MDEKECWLLPFTLLGDMGVGKSCLLHQFTERKCKYAVWWCCSGVEAISFVLITLELAMLE